MFLENPLQIYLLFAKPIQILPPYPPQLSDPESGQFPGVYHLVECVPPDKEKIHNFFRRKKLIFSFFYGFFVEIEIFHIDPHFLILPPAALTQSVIGASANAALSAYPSEWTESVFASLADAPAPDLVSGGWGRVSLMGLFGAISSP